MLRLCADWLRPSPSAGELMADTPGGTAVNGAPPTGVVLVHGAFGAGKSTLLVAIIMFLCRALDADDAAAAACDGDGDTDTASADTPSRRILFAAATNVAVDRVLEGLLERECLHFARVGSVKRISKPVCDVMFRRVVLSSLTPFAVSPFRRSPAQLLPHTLPYDTSSDAIKATQRDLHDVRSRVAATATPRASPGTGEGDPAVENADLLAIDAALAMLEDRKVGVGSGSLGS